MSSTEPGQVKDIVDALRRALQGPASTLASGTVTALGQFTVSLRPPSFQSPSGVANNFTATIDVASQSGWSGTVTLTETDTLTAAGGSVAIQSNNSTVTVAPSQDGLSTLYVAITAATKQGSYTVTVTGTSATGGTATGTFTVIVGAGQISCVNTSDCPAGMVCDNGTCVGMVDNIELHTGPCLPGDVGRYSGICRLSGQCAPTTAADNNCYCTHCTDDCAQYTPQCQAKYGPCSSSILDKNGLCVCSSCSNMANPIQVSCPTNQTVCLDASTPTATTAVSQFTVTNLDSLNRYNLGFFLTLIGLNCACCGLGPSLSSNGFSIGPGANANVTITVPLTCSTAQCYSWTLTVQAELPTGGTIQSFTCPFQICTTTTACFQIQVQCNNGVSLCPSTAWGAVANNTPNNYGGPCACLAAGGITCPTGGGFNWQAVSVNGFAGTIQLTCSVPICTNCAAGGGGQENGCSGFPASITLTSGQTKSIAAPLFTFPSCFSVQHGGLQICNNIMIVTGTAKGLTSTAAANSFSQVNCP